MKKKHLECCGNCLNYDQERNYCTTYGYSFYSYTWCNSWEFDKDKNALRNYLVQ